MYSTCTCSTGCLSPPQNEMSSLSSQLEELDAKSSTAEKSAKSLQEQLQELQVGVMIEERMMMVAVCEPPPLHSPPPLPPTPHL